MKIKNVLVALVLALSLNTANKAIASCARVVDNANILNAANVTPAVDKLTNQGADVFVRTYSSLGTYGTLDQLINSEIHSCANMQNSNGTDRKSNLVIIAINMHPHISGMYLGSQYVSSVTPHDSDIRGQVMNPLLRDGNFNGAISSSLNRIGYYITLSNTVSQGSTTVVNETPTDYKALGEVIYIVLGTFFFGGLLIFLLMFFKKRSAVKAALQAAKSRLESNVTSATDAVNKLRDDSQIKEAANTASTSRIAAANRIVEAFANTLTQYQRIDNTFDVETITEIANQFKKIENSVSNFQWDESKLAKVTEDELLKKVPTPSSYTHEPLLTNTSTPTTHSNSSTYVDNSVTVIETPTYIEPSYPSYKRSHNDDDDNSSGSSSSSWGSSSSWDSSSSSSSDSSSSWDGGSSSSWSGGSDSSSSW